MTEDQKEELKFSFALLSKNTKELKEYWQKDKSLFLKPRNISASLNLSNKKPALIDAMFFLYSDFDYTKLNFEFVKEIISYSLQSQRDIIKKTKLLYKVSDYTTTWPKSTQYIIFSKEIFNLFAKHWQPLELVSVIKRKNTSEDKKIIAQELLAWALHTFCFNENQQVEINLKDKQQIAQKLLSIPYSFLYSCDKKTATSAHSCPIKSLSFLYLKSLKAMQPSLFKNNSSIHSLCKKIKLDASGCPDFIYSELKWAFEKVDISKYFDISDDYTKAHEILTQCYAFDVFDYNSILPLLGLNNFNQCVEKQVLFMEDKRKFHQCLDLYKQIHCVPTSDQDIKHGQSIEYFTSSLIFLEKIDDPKVLYVNLKNSLKILRTQLGELNKKEKFLLNQNYCLDRFMIDFVSKIFKKFNFKFYSTVVKLLESHLIVNINHISNDYHIGFGSLSDDECSLLLEKHWNNRADIFLNTDFCSPSIFESMPESKKSLISLYEMCAIGVEKKLLTQSVPNYLPKVSESECKKHKISKLQAHKI